MSNVTLSAPVSGSLKVNFSDGETEIRVIDLTNNHKVTHAPFNPATEGVFSWALLNAPHTLSLKAKLRIMDNLANQRSPFAGCGRIPNAAITAFLNR